MKKFFILEELFFNSTNEEVLIVVSSILNNLNCVTEDGSKLLLSRIPSEEDVEEIIHSLVLNSETIREMKNYLSIVKSLNLLDLREENALANRLIYELGFSEEIEVVVSVENVIESEDKNEIEN
jgi:hypothetical protein